MLPNPKYGIFCDWCAWLKSGHRSEERPQTRKKKTTRRDPNVVDSKILSAKVTDLPEEAQLNVRNFMYEVYAQEKKMRVKFIFCAASFANFEYDFGSAISVSGSL